MSGWNTTEAELESTFGPAKFAVKYSELLVPDGVTVHCPVAVAFDPSWLTEQAGSSRADTA